MDEAHEFLTGGYKLQIAGNKDSGGESFPTYYCKGRSSKGKCPKRATISASYLDSYSKSRCSQRFKMRTDFSPKPSTQSEQIENAQREGEAAEHELMLYLETDLVSTIGRPLSVRA